MWFNVIVVPNKNLDWSLTTVDKLLNISEIILILPVFSQLRRNLEILKISFVDETHDHKLYNVREVKILGGFSKILKNFVDFFNEAKKI